MTGSNHTKPMCKTIRLSKNKLDNSALWYFINTEEKEGCFIEYSEQTFPSGYTVQPRDSACTE